MELPWDKAITRCETYVDPDHILDLWIISSLTLSLMGYPLNFFVIFFSKRYSRICFKFGMELHHNGVYTACSGNFDPDLDPDFMDHLSFLYNGRYRRNNLQMSSSPKVAAGFGSNFVWSLIVMGSIKFIQNILIRIWCDFVFVQNDER